MQKLDSVISEFFSMAENSDYSSSQSGKSGGDDQIQERTNKLDSSFTSINENDDNEGGVSKVFHSC